MSLEHSPEKFGGDAERPVWGAKAIGEIIGQSERATFHLLAKGRLPATKIGDKYCALPSRLLAHCGGSAKAL
jgi:hypothetical protein